MGSYRQAGRTWNEELHSHMVGVGLAAAHKDPAVYVKGDWDREDFVAGGSWVDNFVGIGSGKDLEVLAKGINEKYGITGFSDVKWILEMLVEHDHTARTISISVGGNSQQTDVDDCRGGEGVAVMALYRTGESLVTCYLLFVFFFISTSGASGDASVLTSIKIIEHN